MAADEKEDEGDEEARCEVVEAFLGGGGTYNQDRSVTGQHQGTVG